MRPYTFKDVQEELAWEPAERVLIAMARAVKEQRRQQEIAEHEHWEQHWRTRLSGALRAWADRVEIPEP